MDSVWADLFLHSSSFILHPSAFILATVGPEGVEPTPCGLKVRRAACYTTTLNLGAAYAFKSTYRQHGKLPLLHTSNFTLPPSSVVVLRIERSVIRLSAEFRQPAFDYQFSRAPKEG